MTVKVQKRRAKGAYSEVTRQGHLDVHSLLGGERLRSQQCTQVLAVDHTTEQAEKLVVGDIPPS
jgi:hypothetical protein